MCVLSVYGGRAIEPQINTLKAGVDVVVGTPGRLLDLSGRAADLSQVRTLVLDEADEMLDMGFLPDVETIVSLVPRQSADDAVLGHHAGADPQPRPPVHDPPTHIRAVDPDDEGVTLAAIEQHIWRAHAMDKVELVARSRKPRAGDW